MNAFAETSTWRRYVASSEHPWNERRVVHLHRRAAFRVDPQTIKRDVAVGPDAAIDRLLHPPTKSTPHESFESAADAIARSATESYEVQKVSTIVEHTSTGDSGKLQAWWLYRILFTSDPVGEKLALMWHNHFATSILKVRDASLMYAQNELFRRYARAPFEKLLFSVIHHPAILIWLDAPSNRRGRPNENLARELMELFTLGIGNYSENDVKEVARALTGWTFRGRKFYEKASFHDDGVKTVLAKRGNWRGDDVLQLLVDHPATARRVAWRLCSVFLNDTTMTTEAVESLAAGLRERHLNVGWAVETILQSELFLSDRNIGSQVACPIEYVAGAVRSLGFSTPPSTRELARWSERMGQALFFPPNVGGWRGGRDWIAHHYVIARANFSHLLLQGHFHREQPDIWADQFLAEQSSQEGLRTTLDRINEVVFGGDISPLDLARIAEASQRATHKDREQLRLATSMMFSRPQAQFI